MLRLTAQPSNVSINAAILAPSAMNLQPWAFAALLNRERIGEYAGRIKSWLLTNFSQTRFDASLRDLIEEESYSVFHHAPALLLVLAKSSQPQAYEDCCLAAENLMLAARDEGLGTCCIGLARPWLNLRSIKHELGPAGTARSRCADRAGSPQSLAGITWAASRRDSLARIRREPSAGSVLRSAQGCGLPPAAPEIRSICSSTSCSSKSISSRQMIRSSTSLPKSGSCRCYARTGCSANERIPRRAVGESGK